MVAAEVYRRQMKDDGQWTSYELVYGEYDENKVKSGSYSWSDYSIKLGVQYSYCVRVYGIGITDDGKRLMIGYNTGGDFRTSDEITVMTKAYPIVYENLMGATHSNPLYYTPGELVKFRSPLAIPGGNFLKWMPSEISSTVTGGMQVVSAQWRLNKYNVVFDGNGGTLTDYGIGSVSSSMEYGDEIVTPNVTRIGYTFTGWSPEVNVTVPAKDVTYVAQWRINRYQVTFVANGGEGGTSMEMDYGATISAPVVTRTGYTFTGWSPDVAATVPTRDVTYVASWKVNQYTVTFDANGGMGGTTVTQDYGTALSAPTVTRTGYTFAGWQPFFPGRVPATNTTYTAKWKINQYTVTFDANDGDGGRSKLMDYGATITAPTVTRTGYTFAGWQPAPLETILASNVTYTAQWKINQYTVTFNANGGSGGTTVTQDYGTALSAPTVTRTGYTFAGWSPAAPATVPAANVTYTAQWQLNRHTVTFDANGGTGGAAGCGTLTTNAWILLSRGSDGTEAYRSPSIAYYESTDMLLTLTGPYDLTFSWRESSLFGYAYLRCYLDGTEKAKVSRTDGKWLDVSVPVPAGEHTVKWTYKGSWFESGNFGWVRLPRITPHVSLNYGQAVGELPKLTRTGHTFKGWFTAASGGTQISASTVVTGDVTYYAHWTVNQYTVTFDANGGTGGKTVTQNYGTALSAPTVMRTGYTLDCWSPAVPATVPASNVTYKAQWQANKYKVTFDANGGTGGKTVTQDYGTVLSAPAVTRTGYTFLGWSPAVPPTVPASNVRYTAQWKINQYTVTFNANGGSGGTTNTVAHGAAVGTLPTPTRDGCTFAGWWTLASGGSRVWASTTVSGNKTYYAHWTVNVINYTVTFNANGGSGKMEDQVFEPGVSQSLRANTFKFSSHMFAGWATSPGGKVVYSDGQKISITSDKVLYAVWEVDANSPIFTIVNGKLTGVKLNGATSVTIPSSVTSIGDEVFRECKGVTDVIIPEGVTSIGALAFCECSDLRSISFPSSLKSIGAYAFAMCGGLDVIKITANVTSIGEYAFFDCWNLHAAALPRRFDGKLAEGVFDECASDFKITYYGESTLILCVVFNANGGKVGSAATSRILVDEGKAIGTLPKATRKGYKLKGWYTKKSGGTKIKATTKIKKNVTYYAQWTANKYKIKFNKNGGKGTMKTLSATYGKTVTLRANTFKRAKYTFAGWAKTKKGKVAYKNKAKVKNLTATNGKTVTLYAKWKKAKSSSVKSAAKVSGGAKSARSASSVKSAASASVPAWAVGTFHGGSEVVATTITVSKTGKVSGKVVFADGRWMIVGKANGKRIEAVVTDDEGNCWEVALAIIKKEDGSCRIESEDGSIWAE